MASLARQRHLGAARRGTAGEREGVRRRSDLGGPPVWARSTLALAVWLGLLLAPAGRSQTSWPSIYGGPGNTASTAVRFEHPEALTEAWCAPGSDAPLVYWDEANQRQLVICGPFIYSAWDGKLLGVLPQCDPVRALGPVPAGAAIDVANGILVTTDGNALVAYDLGDPAFRFLWRLDLPSVANGVADELTLNVADGVLYLGGRTALLRRVGRLWAVQAFGLVGDAGAPLTGAPYKKWLTVGDPGFLPHVVAVATGTVLVTLDASGRRSGPVALDVETGAVLWSSPALGDWIEVPSVDYETNRAFVGWADWAADGVAGVAVFDESYQPGDAPTVAIWSDQFDCHNLNGPLTHGWVARGILQTPALFAVANGSADPSYTCTVLALDRETLDVLWFRHVLDAYTTTTFSGNNSVGHLYLAERPRPEEPDYQVLHVLNAADGTDACPPYQSFSTTVSLDCPVIVEAPHPTDAAMRRPMLISHRSGQVFAMSDVVAAGEPIRRAFGLTARADPVQIPPASQTTQPESAITVTFLDDLGGPIPNARIRFSSEGPNNTGALSGTVASTDANGVATIRFLSGSQEGTVLITAQGPAPFSATVTITVKKDGAEPPATGSISGTVTNAGRLVRAGRVDLLRDGSLLRTATTTSKGKYTFADIPAGVGNVYAVTGYDGSASGSVTSILVGDGGTSTANIVIGSSTTW